MKDKRYKLKPYKFEYIRQMILMGEITIPSKIWEEEELDGIVEYIVSGVLDLEKLRKKNFKKEG